MAIKYTETTTSADNLKAKVGDKALDAAWTLISTSNGGTSVFAENVKDPNYKKNSTDTNGYMQNQINADLNNRLYAAEQTLTGLANGIVFRGVGEPTALCATTANATTWQNVTLVASSNGNKVLPKGSLIIASKGGSFFGVTLETGDTIIVKAEVIVMTKGSGSTADTWELKVGSTAITNANVNSYFAFIEHNDSYLTTTAASSTYLTQTNASNTYLKKTDAENTYAKKNDVNIPAIPLSTSYESISKESVVSNSYYLKTGVDAVHSRQLTAEEKECILYYSVNQSTYIPIIFINETTTKSEGAVADMSEGTNSQGFYIRVDADGDGQFATSGANYTNNGNFPAGRVYAPIKGLDTILA